MSDQLAWRKHYDQSVTRVMWPDLSGLSTGVVIAVLLTLILIVAIPVAAKAWPILTLQSANAKEKLRNEGRSDLSDCKARLDRMAERVDGLYDTVSVLKIELAGVVSAYRILEVAEETRDPFSIHLAQARAILATASTLAPHIKKSDTLRAAEEAKHSAGDTYIAADATVEQVKRDEREP